MARRQRPYLPGVVFHLTARTQGHRPWFAGGIRSRIIEIIGESIRHSDGRLLAYAVMPNHLHIVVRQGEQSLSRIMQPILRRTALLVHRVHGAEGHVFERRFRDEPCRDLDYLRNIIVYTHLNPVRADLCEHPIDYEWTSHRTYATCSRKDISSPEVLDVAAGLRLFAHEPERTRTELRSDYTDFIRWRMKYDKYLAAIELGTASGLPPTRPTTTWESERHNFRADPALEGTRGQAACSVPQSRPDLTTLTKDTLTEFDPAPELAWVRSRYGGRPVVRARHEVIRRADAAGYRGVEIARFLNVSPAMISRVLSATRKPKTRSAAHGIT